MQSIKYCKAMIKIGAIELECFQMPDGSYRFSQTQVLESIGAAKNWIAVVTKRGDESLKWLHSNGFQGVTESIKVPCSNGYATAKTLSLEDAVIVWGYHNSIGNVKAKALILACAMEALERRADAAFGRDRSEAERNDRLAARQKGIHTRRELTDAIQDYLLRTPEASENERKWIYSNTTNAMYRAVFGMTAIELEEFLGCDRHEARNGLSTKCLRKIDFAETLLCQFIDEDTAKPADAVSHAMKVIGIKRIAPVAKEAV
jgi:hypothetical protein